MTATIAARWGFDPARFAFAWRTALTACVALFIAWALGLEHPQWTAMSVWAAAQPTRGMLLEKSLFRAAGTVIGVAAGVLLMTIAGPDQRILVLGLTLWIVLCAWLGNVLHGFVSYGAILAGYSASMVALLDIADPGHPLALGLDRLLTVLVGVAVAALAGMLFTPSEAEDAVEGAVRGLSARLLRVMARRLKGQPATEAESHALLTGMAAIDEALDRHGAGSLRSRRSARRLRDALAAQLVAFVWLRDADADRPDSAIAAALDRAADALENAATPFEAAGPLAAAAVLAGARPALREALSGLGAALGEPLPAPPPARPRHQPTLILHRDWVGARQAALRAGITLLLVGTAWQLSGMPQGAFLMLGVSVMLSLFSPMENPALTMRQVAIGQVFGVMGAIACRWLAWPHADSELGLILWMMPFILLGAPAMAHRRSMGSAMDYNLVMLLLLQPHLPLTGTIGGSVATGVAVVLAPLIALVAFHQLFPADARRRMQTLIAMMVHEVQAMAADAGAVAHRPLWRARLRHRLLRLVRWAQRRGLHPDAAMEGGIAVLRLGTAVIGLQARRDVADLAPGTRRAVLAALQRLRRVGRDPEAAGRALDRAARRLTEDAPDEAVLLRDAAASLAANRDFFRLGGARPAA